MEKKGSRENRTPTGGGRSPRKIDAVLTELLARRGYARIQGAARCAAVWREAVGESLSAQTRAGGVRRGVLDVLCGNSAIAQEISFRKLELLEKLRELAPEEKIRDLRYRVGAIA